jgi:phosphoribosylamine--glycine ligase
MKILLVSKWGDSLDIAYQLGKEGHEVKMYIQDKANREIGFGFVQKTNHWERFTDWADLIVFDYTGFGAEADRLREEGKTVFGGSIYTDSLELDRNFGHKELIKHGIKVLASQEFDHFSEAIGYIEQHPDAYVIKPCGETQELKQLLFVGQDDEGKDVIHMLKAYEKTWGVEFGSFQIQRKVKGVEIAISGFFNGQHFLRPFNINFEHKKLFPNELGVSTGEMGTSMYWSSQSMLAEKTLLKLEKTLASYRFHGHLDINAIVNGHGIYPLEFTSRFGYPQVYIQKDAISENFGELLWGVANGTKKTIHVKKGFQVGAYMVVPPFPFNDPKSFRLFSKDSVVVFKTPNREGIHPVQVKKINDQWLVTGDSGIVVLVTGGGLTIKDAQKNMYNRISNIIINNSYYRNDIGNRWAEDSDKLLSWGYL